MFQKDLYITPNTQELSHFKRIRREALLSLGNFDMDKVDFLLHVSYDLTPLGFECFVAYFLQEHFKYKTQVTGGYNDGGIDIKGIRKDEVGNTEYAIVQCKRWNARHIGISEIASFYGKIVDIRFHHPNTQLFYATTSYMTGQARAFMAEKNITYLDFDTFLNVNVYITREGFFEYLQGHALELMAYKHDKDQTQLFIDTHRDVFELLKQVRYQIASEFHVPLHDIANSRQLCELIRHAPMTVNEFIGIGGFDTRKAALYGQKFVKVFADNKYLIRAE